MADKIIDLEQEKKEKQNKKGNEQVLDVHDGKVGDKGSIGGGERK